MPLPRWLALGAIVLVALVLRGTDLARRPMHADEANQAVKTGELLEGRGYAFDPRDHHGPTLYFATLPVAWLRGEHTLAELSETTVRLVPAMFGTLAVLLLGLLPAASRPEPGHGKALPAVATLEKPRGPSWTWLLAAGFLAVSPPAVYYARYFIQETLLVAFTLLTILAATRWHATGARAWAVVAGAGAGLMLATKESALFLLAAALAALLWETRSTFRRAGRPRRAGSTGPHTPSLRATPLDRGSEPAALCPADSLETRRPRRVASEPDRPIDRSTVCDLLLALGTALVVAALLYSSFGTHPSGIVDALAAPWSALGRVAGPTGHEKPWWYYLRLLSVVRSGGLLWEQTVFVLLAVIGTIAGFWLRSAWLRGAAVYAALMLVALSAVPYKTPWNVIHVLPPLCVLAAGGVGAIARLRTGRIVAAAFAFLAFATLLAHTRRAAFQRGADPRNPWAYVHSSPDVLKYRALVQAALAAAPDQPVRIIGEEYWPLPWYLRGLPRIGYWTDAPAECDGALVIASGRQVETVRARLHGTYHERFLGLRPGVMCVVFAPAREP